ncbi:MAG: MBOAT family protein [Prolixibacteraceae bacterium]|nr:MBOAT family protein [Prolixibacteraceae bacterium]MBN2773135.1 MBOAT family protein [Prolixibacteraceae bacterium]
MLFNSVTFLVFITIVFLIYWKTAGISNRLNKLVLLLSSYIFYAWWDWRFLSLILISSVTDYLIGILIFRNNDKTRRKLLLTISILVNIGILGFFKYFNFFVDSLHEILGSQVKEFSTLHIILPVGISFYTFQTLSYTIDVYRKKIKPTSSALTFFTYVAFFPQLVAGPIERAGNLLPQIEKKKQFSENQAKEGLRLILWGLFKKMVIADQFARVVDLVYGNPAGFNGFEILVATLFFGFQIYCDFSGYSDIAIGVAKLLGIELMVNFRTPYFAASFRNFWQRWHISLSTWFRDYIYIPLGGNRCSNSRWIINIVITFVLSGLWHGASVTFIIWGASHGILLIGERYFQRIFHLKGKFQNIIGWIITFSLVNLNWIFFRAGSLPESVTIFKNIFSMKAAFNESFINQFKMIGDEHYLSLVLLVATPVLIATEIITGNKTFAERLSGFPRFVRWTFYYVLLIMILFLGVLKTAPQFIYFQF